MKISQLINHLKSIKDVEGDINVCYSQDHEYWCELHNYLENENVVVKEASPNDPSGNTERAVVFGVH